MSQNTEQEKLFFKLQSIAENHVSDEEFTIEKFCELASTSRTQLHRKIKAATGLSTSHFLRKMRLEKARSLLSDKSLNLSEITYASGFKNPQYLSRYFLAEYGITPSKFRKNLLLDDAGQKLPEDTTLTPKVSSEHQTGKAKQSTPIVFQKYKYILISVLLLLILLLTYTMFKSRGENTIEKSEALKPTPFVNSIAVLPFTNIGETSNNFGIGLVEDILTNLTRYDALKVISRTSSDKYSNTNKSIREIGEELGVIYILEGSIRTFEDSVIVTAQLIQANGDYHLWAKNYKEKFNNYHILQQDISLEIAKSLEQNITLLKAKGSNNNTNLSRESRQNYLLASELLKQRTASSLQKSKELFLLALNEKEDYTQALVGLATANWLTYSLNYDPDPAYLDFAEKHLLKAIKSDPSYGPSYSGLGNIYREKYRWEEAKLYYEIALKHNPNNALANYWYSLLLREIGELDLALEFSQRASDLDPLYPVIQGGHLYNFGLANKAIDGKHFYDKTKAILGKNFLFTAASGMFFECTGEYETAGSLFEESILLNPDFKGLEVSKLVCQGRLGNKKVVLDYLENNPPGSKSSNYVCAELYASIGLNKKSLEHLDLALRDDFLSKDIIVKKRFESIRDTKKFKDIVSRYGLDYYLD